MAPWNGPNNSDNRKALKWHSGHGNKLSVHKQGCDPCQDMYHMWHNGANVAIKNIK